MIPALDALRDNGLTINAANLARLGVSDSIIPRTIQAFKILDLLDEQGSPTQALVDFKQAPTETYKERLAESLRAAYAPVFAVTGADPSQKPMEQIHDAFRTYTPASLRDRMVTLFLGLCEYAGIVEEAPTRKPGPKTVVTPSGKKLLIRKKAPGPSQPPASQPLSSSRSGSNTVHLASGGTLTLSFVADLWDLSPDDRHFLFDVIDKLKSYEGQRQLPAGSSLPIEDGS